MMLWLMDESAGFSMAIQAKNIYIGREVLSEGALTGFRHYRNTLKDQSIKASIVLGSTSLTA